MILESVFSAFKSILGDKFFTLSASALIRPKATAAFVFFAFKLFIKSLNSKLRIILKALPELAKRAIAERYAVYCVCPLAVTRFTALRIILIMPFPALPLKLDLKELIKPLMAVKRETGDVLLCVLI